jgi:hypothetical protein
VDYYGFMNKLHQGEIDQKEFQTYGLQSTKNLVKYDVWDEVYSYYDRKWLTRSYSLFPSKIQLHMQNLQDMWTTFTSGKMWKF